MVALLHYYAGCWELIQMQLRRDGASQRTASKVLLVVFSNSPKWTRLVYPYFFPPYLCLQCKAPQAWLSQAACGRRRVHGGDRDGNLFSSRFIPDTGNATPLMVTRQHPGKASRVEWETGWRSCWISSKMSICPSGERQVSLKNYLSNVIQSYATARDNSAGALK